ncbi:hypothetical protein [Salimicrobium flavidum]|uniref:hypothetical protein n=1 Tax=Salimicrobium flavidum TaxID=570947 RepID=UPI00117AD624|nr:hypothetical protein [Salimicrobium flavidum]
MIIFGGGYYAGSIGKEEVSIEVIFGYPSSENPDQVDYSHTFKNTEHQAIVDNLLMIYLNKEKVTSVDVDVNHPDIYMQVISPKRSTSLVDSRIWFTEAGPIIGQRDGGNWDNNIEYYRIDENDGRYIQEIIEDQKEERS